MTSQEESKKVSILLGVGIFFMPYFFSWVTLKHGYSNRVKFISFLWLVLVITMMLKEANQENTHQPAKSVSNSLESAVQTPLEEKISDEWSLAAGNLWVGVTLYYGDNKRIVGKVIGFNNNVTLDGQKFFKGVKLNMNDSKTEEWKTREAIVTGPWYVKKDDPALQARQYLIVN